MPCSKTTKLSSPIAKFMGPTWGPSGANRTQVGPMLAPWTLLSGMLYNKTHPYCWKCFSWHRDWCFHLGNVLIAFIDICYETGFNMKWWYFQLQQQWVLLKINTLRPGENGRHFPDDIFKCIFLNEDIWISIQFSLKLIQIMAWHRPGDKPLSEPMMVVLPAHIGVTRPQWVKVYDMWHFSR